MISCEKPPNYSDTPKIEYLSITKETIITSSSNSFADTVTISIGFEDGDGDLGLNTTDIEGSDKFVGEYIFNYFIDVYKRNNNEWEEIDFELIGGTGLDSRFSRLLPAGVSPIDGDLNFGLNLVSGTLLKPNDTLRFEVNIVDRELNRSNTITTDYIVFGIP